jgi:copper resistance protein B
MKRAAATFSLLLVAALSHGQEMNHKEATVAQQNPPTTGRKLPYFEGWPKPINDEMKVSFFELENFEFFREGNGTALRWDAIGWYGGPKRRTWFKTLGDQNLSESSLGTFEVQLLDGQLVSPNIDLVYGVRYFGRNGSVSTRGQSSAVIGLQGLLPYRFGFESSLFLSDEGQLSARLSGSYQIPLTQRLFLVPSTELNMAASRSNRMGIEPGINETEFGIRLRYEIKREFAPYVGYVWTSSKASSLDEGGSGGAFVFGVRAWF